MNSNDKYHEMKEDLEDKNKGSSITNWDEVQEEIEKTNDDYIKSIKVKDPIFLSDTLITYIYKDNVIFERLIDKSKEYIEGYMAALKLDPDNSKIQITKKLE